jgi:hypothetical protein
MGYTVIELFMKPLYFLGESMLDATHQKEIRPFFGPSIIYR